MSGDNPAREADGRADRDALAVMMRALGFSDQDTDEIVSELIDNRDAVLRALGIKETDRDAVRKTVEGAMSTAEGRWTGNPVDITNALVDFLQWESDKYKARAEAAERKVARAKTVLDAWQLSESRFQTVRDIEASLTTALADEEATDE